MNKRKEFSKLNLLDRFLFDEAMEDSENMKTVLDIILGQDIPLRLPPHSEKEIRTFPDNRQVRLDVYAWDDDDTVYDTEAQKEDTKNLPKRSRFYQAVLDSNLLPPGSVDFNKLNRAFIILIMPFDPFGKGFYKYTFRMKCEECPDLDLQDDATRIFLNCHGTHPEMVSPELIELLHYMEKSTNEVAGSCTSQKIKLLHQKVCQIRSNKKMEAKFMRAWEEREIERQKAFAEGEEAGIETGKTQGKNDLLKSQVKKKLEKKYSKEQIADMLEEDVATIETIINELQQLNAGQKEKNYH